MYCVTDSSARKRDVRDVAAVRTLVRPRYGCLIAIQTSHSVMHWQTENLPLGYTCERLYVKSYPPGDTGP